MPDGVRVALAVSYPAGYQPGTRWPALFEMDGYDGGGGALDPSEWGNHYVLVHASLRGTGCSGGAFDLFSMTSALDGADLVETWIPGQRWSNGSVGIIGHSYPGLTGFWVAEADAQYRRAHPGPQHLKAMSVSGLIDDLYRGITYTGGIPDPGFPLLWTALARPGSELAGNYQRYLSDAACPANLAARGAPDVTDDPLLNGLVTRDDGQWYWAHSLITLIGNINVPVHITQQYQDEQTGPRGGVELWQHLPNVPKRLVLTNGVHATHFAFHADDVAWMDCWVRQRCAPGVNDPAQRVQVHFETRGLGNDPTQDATNPAFVSSDYPLPQTTWSRLYLDNAKASLTETAPTRAEAGRSYLVTPVGRQAYVSGAGAADATVDQAEPTLDGAYHQGYGRVDSSSGPDQLTYRSGFGPRATVTVAGPIEADLWLSSTAPDTDLFVQLLDVDAHGNVSYLQRGMVRASYRAVDAAQSDYIGTGPQAGQMYRPYHPFTNAELLTPAQPFELRIEVFPLGHVFRPGHQLEIQIYSPPAADELYAYGSGQPTALNTILTDPRHPSSVLIPVLAGNPPISASAPPCGSMTGVRCVQPLG